MRDIDSVTTQKARGVLALQDTPGFTTPAVIVIGEEGEIEDDNIDMWVTRAAQPLNFARPCPPTPEHGFIDSRVVESAEDVRTLLRAAKCEHEASEVMLMPFMAPEYSGILSSGMLAMGAGHDAATAGKSTLRLPLGPLSWSEALLVAAGITQAPYLEFVSIKPEAKERYSSPTNLDTLWGNVYAVQLRNGPTPVLALDYIPETIERVTEVVRPLPDMIEWKQWCIAHAGQKGLVVQLGENATLLSHEAVHCIDNKIACVTTMQVEEGERLEPVKLPETFDIHALMDGMRATLPRDYGWGIAPFTRAMRVVLLATHHHAYLRSTLEGSRLIGIAASYAAQLGAMACLGELRHKRRRRGSREAVFHKAQKNLTRAVTSLTRAERDFSTLHWAGGFGGRRWAECAAATIELVNAMIDLGKKPTQKKASRIVTAMHEIVHIAHNGGRFLNKFISQGEMDSAAQGRPDWVLHQAIPAVWNALHREPAKKGPVVGRRTPLKRYQPDFSGSDFQIRMPSGWTHGACVVHAQVRPHQAGKVKSSAYKTRNFSLPERVMRVLVQMPALAPSFASSMFTYVECEQGGILWKKEESVAAYIRCAVNADGNVFIGQFSIGNVMDILYKGTLQITEGEVDNG